jgi:hypothetical protein
VLLLIAAGVAFYVPLNLRYGDLWLTVIKPFVLQPGRAFFYAAWFFAGFLTGSIGLDQGLLAEQGRLARGWPGWVVLGLAGGNALWFAGRSRFLAGLAPLPRQVILDLIWVVACVSICVGLTALFRARAHRRRLWADSLARHAYAIYAFHYIFVLWIERELLGVSAPAVVKFSFCLVISVALSWAAALAWLRVWALCVGWLRGSETPASSSGVGLGAQPAEQAVRRRA